MLFQGFINTLLKVSAGISFSVEPPTKQFIRDDRPGTYSEMLDTIDVLRSIEQSQRSLFGNQEKVLRGPACAITGLPDKDNDTQKSYVYRHKNSNTDEL